MTASNDTHSTDSLYVGIDVSKDTLDVARSDGDSVATFSNNSKAVAKLAAALKKAQPTLIVAEATGGYEAPVVAALLDADLPIAVANPRQVRHLAKGLGVLAKTDAIDAHVLVAYARHAQPRLAEKRDKNREELEALVTCRRQLLVVRTEQRNRREHTQSANARRALDAVLRAVNKQIEELDTQIKNLIDSDDDMSRLDRIIRSAPGVGTVLSATLLASFSEMGQLDRREVSALMGVAPFNRDSGRFTGSRAIRGGRHDVRTVLYMATLSAKRCNPVISEFADRLKAEGKCPKVVTVACMRKLTTILNAMIRDRLEWPQLKLVQKS